MTYLSGIALLLLVVSPPLVPLTISGIRIIAKWPRAYQRLQARIGRQGPVLAAAD